MRRRRNYKKYFPYLFRGALLIILTILVWWLVFLSPYLEIEKIKISGSDSVNTKEIKTTSKKVFHSNSFFFDSQNLFYALLRKEKLKRNLKEKFPVFKRVKITPEILTDKIKIELKERERLAILKQKESPNFYFDRQGILFGEAPEYEGRLITLVETPNSKFKKGDQIAPEDLRKSIIELLKNNYLKQDLSLSKIDIRAKGKELHAHILEGARLEFSLADEPLSKNREITLLKKVMQEKVQSKKDQLKYIDLRVQNRAYIKYKEDNENSNSKKTN